MSTIDDALAAANRRRCERCGKPGAMYVPGLGRMLCIGCHLDYREDKETPEAGVWYHFDRIRPSKAAPYGYLVVLPETRSPVLAQFDEESKRFKVYCQQIGKDIQVPVKMWFRIPDVPAA